MRTSRTLVLAVATLTAFAALSALPLLDKGAEAHEPGECACECVCPPEPYLVCPDGSVPVGVPQEPVLMFEEDIPVFEESAEEGIPVPAAVPRPDPEQQDQQKQEAVQRALDAIEAVEEYDRKH